MPIFLSDLTFTQNYGSLCDLLVLLKMYNVHLHVTWFICDNLSTFHVETPFFSRFFYGISTYDKICANWLCDIEWSDVPFGFSRILKPFSLSMAGNIKPILTKTYGQQSNFFQNLIANLWNIFTLLTKKKKVNKYFTKLQRKITRPNWVSVRLRHSPNHDASYFSPQ